MRYDIVTKDLLASSAPFSPAPGTPVVTGRATLVRGSSAEPTVLPEENRYSRSEEDSVVPLFPEDEAYSDPDYVPDSAPPPLRGKVRIRLDEVARLRGLVITKGRHRGHTNLSAIQRGTGLAYATLYKLLRTPDEQTAISIEVLTRLCEFMHCQPGDLLVWEPRAQEPSTSISDYFQRKERRASSEEQELLGERSEPHEGRNGGDRPSRRDSDPS